MPLRHTITFIITSRRVFLVVCLGLLFCVCQTLRLLSHLAILLPLLATVRSYFVECSTTEQNSSIMAIQILTIALAGFVAICVCSRKLCFAVIWTNGQSSCQYSSFIVCTSILSPSTQVLSLRGLPMPTHSTMHGRAKDTWTCIGFTNATEPSSE